MCVCVCVCLFICLNNKDAFFLYNFIKILSSYLMSIFFSGWNRGMNLPKASRALSSGVGLETISVNSSTNSNLKPRHLSGNLKGS